MNVPTMKQMLTRAHSGHHAALRATSDGTSAVGPTAPLSAVRGMRTCLATLRAWECIVDDALTDRGRQLLSALDDRVAARGPYTGRRA